MECDIVPFDPPTFSYGPPHQPLRRCLRMADPTVFECPICCEPKVNPYQLAQAKQGIPLPVNCTLRHCSYCPDARVVAG